MNNQPKKQTEEYYLQTGFIISMDSRIKYDKRFSHGHDKGNYRRIIRQLRELLGESDPHKGDEASEKEEK